MERDGFAYALGRSVRRRREAKNLTQRNLADLAGVHYQTVRSIELGRHGSSYKLGDVAEALGIKLETLMRDAEAGSSVMFPDVGALVRHLMDEQGVTADELSERIGTDRETVDRLMSGDCGPLLWGAAAVAFGVPLAAFEAAVVDGFDRAAAVVEGPRRRRRRRQ